MIPKIIHYCWISDESCMSDNIKQCIESWHKYLPDYEFINWNDKNFDWSVCKLVKQFREDNLYAFCSDYIRFWAIYNYGGIYLDTDVMVYKSFDELLSMNRIITNQRIYTFNNDIEAAIIGGHKGDEIFKRVLDFYDNYTNNRQERWTNIGIIGKGHIIAPEVISRSWKPYYIYNIINTIKDEHPNPQVISILNSNKYFDSNSEECFCEHQFFGSWLKTIEQQFNDKEYDDLFKQIYESRFWNSKEYKDEEFFSGVGSADKYHVIKVTNYINTFIKTHNIHSILDFGCGDFRVGRKIKVDMYYGCDIYDKLIEHDKITYEDDTHKFLLNDHTYHNLPRTDLILIKDVLQHLDNYKIKEILDNLISWAKYIIIIDSASVSMDKINPTNINNNTCDINILASSKESINSVFIPMEYPFNYTGFHFDDYMLKHDNHYYNIWIYEKNYN